MRGRLQGPVLFPILILGLMLVPGCTYYGAWDLLAFIDEVDPWFDDAWPTRIKLTFGNTHQDEDLVDFPLLVVLNPDRVDYGTMAADGSDIRFVDHGSAAILPYEIEEWNPSGTSYLWVRVPAIDRGSDSDHIWLYYGNPGAPTAGDAGSVWTNGYRGVWHLNGSLSDSSPSPHDGVNSGTVATAGFLSGGRSFDGASYVRVPDNPDLAMAGPLTMEVWANRQSPAGTRVIMVSKWNTTADQRSYELGSDRSYNENRAFLMVSQSGLLQDPGGTLDSPGPEPGDTWNYLVGVYTGADLRIYSNGLQRAAVACTEGSLFQSAEDLIIGARDDGTIGIFQGILDEVRLSAVARSSDWIAAQYLAMTDRFITYGRPHHDTNDAIDDFMDE